MRTIVLFTMILLSISVSAQRQIVSTAGETDKNSAGSISWTMGEVVAGTLGSGELMLSQGFQQGSIEVKTGLVNSSEFSIDIKAYPNPVRDKMNLELVNPGKLPLYVELYNIKGVLLQRREVNASELELNFQNYASGQYVLRIKSEEKLVQTFFIIKH
jgi:hypothetical protein